MVQTSSSFRRDSRDPGETISLSEVVSALSYALDLTEGAVEGHALRSCVLGMRIGAAMGLSASHRNGLYYALLLKDIGGNNAGHMGEIAGIPLRCDRGAGILHKLGMGVLAEEAVRYLDERWDGGGYPEGLQGEEIPLLARICAVARHLDLFFAGRDAQSAIDRLDERKGTWFDPALVRVAVSLHRKGELWMPCSAKENLDEVRCAVLDLDPGRTQVLAAAAIDPVCEAFADVVDAKSHFTFSHSMGVADAAVAIAAGVGLSAERAQLVRRAALLHDIGKLSVSNTILDKTGKLNAREWQSVRQHPGYTRSILERVGSFQEIAVIAGEHHEKLDGSGYPNQLMAPDLSMEARIIAVADVYGALSEDRPYRAGLEFEQIVPIMKRLAPRKLDADCVEALIAAVYSRRETVFAPALLHAGPEMIYAAG